MGLDQEGRYGSRWETVRSIAGRVGCSAEALRKWVQRAEIDAGDRPGLTTDERARLKELERELRQANEILRKSSACFAKAELDRYPRCHFEGSLRIDSVVPRRRLGKLSAMRIGEWNAWTQASSTL